jgi:hypothetical protein
MRIGFLLLLVIAWFCNAKGICQQAGAHVELVAKEQQNRVDVVIAGKPFTSYLYLEELKKPVLWPVISAAGDTLTRSYPFIQKEGERIDHPHHVGVWFNYGNVNGLDFWNNSQKVSPEKKHRYGAIYHRSIETLENGEGKAKLVTTADWKSSDSSLMITETTVFEFIVMNNTRIVDRITTLTAMMPEVMFTDNKEGMFAIRVARQLELPATKPTKVLRSDGQPVEMLSNEEISGNYLSATGIQGKEVWGTRSRWMKLSGTINGSPESIIIIDHPDNPGYPTFWHARDYGLFSANPLGQRIFSDGELEMNFTLKSGESVTFHHRLVLAPGSITNRQINMLADQFAIK